MTRFAVFLILMVAGTGAFAQVGCSEGSYSVIRAPDGSALSILFDDFVVTNSANEKNKVCSISIPLKLPEGFSLGVYKVDYRGFARLASKQAAELSVDYALGPNKTRRFHRKIKGPTEGDFAFTETIGAGLMKRVGCGDAALLNVAVALRLGEGQVGELIAALDSADGAAKGGLIYHFDLKKCR